MSIYTDSFVVYADYVPTGFGGLSFLISLVLACGVLIIGIAIYARTSDSERSSRESKSDTFKDAATISTIVGTASLIVFVGGMLSGPYSATVPFIDTIITAPEDCAIHSDTVNMSSDTIIAISDLPEGQKRATYHVNATCKDVETLQQLLELDESIIPLDHQPVNAGGES